ncbi:MAG TPA: hypothetical protein VNW52_13115 [Burkholderiaceae bacterium]|jgi:hypothetical protein|nr:hypothetical protein [Burkholderiaceae bacterium]
MGNKLFDDSVQSLKEAKAISKLPKSHSVRGKEEQRVLQLVQEGLASGPAIPVDDALLARLRSHISPKL